MKKYKIVLDVCETHNLSKTAVRLNYTQSAVSQAIKSFEKELGFPMFKRSKYGMELMPKLLLKNVPFDVCVREFSEHYSRVLGVAYHKDTPPTLATMKLLDYIGELTKKKNRYLFSE